MNGAPTAPGRGAILRARHWRVDRGRLPGLATEVHLWYVEPETIDDPVLLDAYDALLTPPSARATVDSCSRGTATRIS